MLRLEFEYLAPKFLDEETSSSSNLDSNDRNQSFSESDIDENEQFEDAVEQYEPSNYESSKAYIEEDLRSKMFTEMGY